MANVEPIATIIAASQERGGQAKVPYFGVVLPTEAFSILIEVSGARLVDVRTSAEWDYVGHVPESRLVQWNLYPDGQRNPVFMQELQRAAPDRDAPVLFLCRSGQRSDAAARAAAAAGYSKAFNILEGFEGAKDPQQQRGKLGGWRKAGLPWVQG